MQREQVADRSRAPGPFWSATGAVASRGAAGALVNTVHDRPVLGSFFRSGSSPSRFFTGSPRNRQPSRQPVWPRFGQRWSGSPRRPAFVFWSARAGVSVAGVLFRTVREISIRSWSPGFSRSFAFAPGVSPPKGGTPTDAASPISRTMLIVLVSARRNPRRGEGLGLLVSKQRFSPHCRSVGCSCRLRLADVALGDEAYTLACRRQWTRPLK